MSGTLNPPGAPTFNEVLITTVRLYPPLYINNRRAFDNVDRSALWEEVATKIGRQVTPEFAKKRWLQLRDRYRKELKVAIAQGFSQPHKWSHFHLLKWLDPFLQGTLSLAASDCKDALSDNSSFLLPDAYNSNNASFASFANSFFSNPQDQDERAESCDSELLEDVKPTMTAMQTVLAATEASAKAAAAASQKLNLEEETEPRTSLAEFLHRLKQNSLLTMNPEYSNSNSKGPPSPSGQASSENSSASSPKISLSCKDQDVYPSNDLLKERRMPATTSKYAYRVLPPRTLRFRSRKTFKKRRLAFKREAPPRPEEAAEACSQPPDSSPQTSNWFDDEDLLFGRIVGLRLKKMDISRRKTVRLRIAQLLDDEETLMDGLVETGSGTRKYH